MSDIEFEVLSIIGVTRKHLFTYIRLDAFTIIYNRRHNKVIVFEQRKSLHIGKKMIKLMFYPILTR